MPVKKQYRIPLIWSMYGHVTVEADSVEEAIAYALGPECPLPDGSYLDASAEVDESEIEEID